LDATVAALVEEGESLLEVGGLGLFRHAPVSGRVRRDFQSCE
jgi:hypothetical protein